MQSILPVTCVKVHTQSKHSYTSMVQTKWGERLWSANNQEKKAWIKRKYRKIASGENLFNSWCLWYTSLYPYSKGTIFQAYSAKTSIKNGGWENPVPYVQRLWMNKHKTFYTNNSLKAEDMLRQANNTL